MDITGYINHLSTFIHYSAFLSSNAIKMNDFTLFVVPTCS